MALEKGSDRDPVRWAGLRLWRWALGQTTNRDGRINITRTALAIGIGGMIAWMGWTVVKFVQDERRVAAQEVQEEREYVRSLRRSQ